MSRRVGIILSHPTQYYSPWFQWIRAHATIDLRVFYLWEFGVTERRDPQFQTTIKWNVDLLSGYESEFVPNVAADPGTHHFFGLRNPELLSRMRDWRPEALLIFGYKWSSHLRAIAWARRRGIPLLFRGDSHLLGRAVGSPLKQATLRLLYRQFAAFLAVGAANREYFTRLGVPEAKIFFAPHAVDASRFDPTLPAYAAEASRLRGQLGISPTTTVVLFAGKFVSAKQPCELLEAYVDAAVEDTALVFVGDGPEKPTLLELARKAARSIHFLPFANQTEMPARYLLGNVFALPSRGSYETWGLAVNESMHMGVPALVSNLVGCQRDLVTDHETGWVFDAGEPGSLTAALRRAIDTVRNPTLSAKIREKVRRRISQYTYVQATAGLEAALTSVAR